jgi:molecular chaperone GrpE
MEEEIILEDEGEGLEDKLKKLREKLKKCESEKQEYLAGWQRARADFINARKEEGENRQEFLKFCESNLIIEFLALADSFDSLFKMEKIDPARNIISNGIDKNWRTGIENLYGQLMNILKSRGIEIIESEGKIFNPEEHESIGEIKVDSKEKEGIIVEVLRKGYKMYNKIIRPAQVRVGKLET